MRKSGKREMRGLTFLCIAIALALEVCISSIISFNVFSIVVSVALVGLLCVGLGYKYGNDEEAIEAHFEEKAREKKERETVEAIMGVARKSGKPNNLEGEKEVGEVEVTQ